MNFYAKLLTMQTDDSFILLYGFSAPTSQEVYSWRKNKLDKKGELVCYHTIWSESQEIELEESLVKDDSVLINKDTIIIRNIQARPQALSDHIHEGMLERNPVSGFHLVSEYWNVEKGLLMDNLTMHYQGTQTKTKHENFLVLLQTLTSECGIDFAKEYWRFGNYEVYREPKHQHTFHISVSKEDGLGKTVIERTKPISTPIIIRCASEHRCRWHIDSIKTLFPEDTSVTFEAQEPMSRVRIAAWNASTGELVASYERTLVMSMGFQMGISSNPYEISDNWTNKLQRSAPNQSKRIKDIKTTKYVSHGAPSQIRSSTYSAIDRALEEGEHVLAPYKIKSTKGAFIPKTGDINGEILSFLKIIEYISGTDLKRVIIADPFFSVTAGEKFLCRIPNKGLTLEIITSLTTKNPNTNQNEDAEKVCQDFLLLNQGKLHPYLIVKNLHRGTQQAFHDRYLIRQNTRGKIDGFLLSNSLNSAGQSFPFVISPLEEAICEEVYAYLQDITNPEIQKQLPQKIRINCNVLFDNTKKENISHPRQSVLFPLLKERADSEPDVVLSKKLTAALRTESDRQDVRFEKTDLSLVIQIFNQCWQQSSSKALNILGEALGHTCCWTPDEVVIALRNQGVDETKLIQELCSFALEVEQSQDYTRHGIESEEFRYRSLLKGSAQISKQGLDTLLNHPGHVYYPGENYSNGFYRLLLALSPKKFVYLMEETSSPQMFDVLLLFMCIGGWKSELYEALLASNISWLPALAAEWVHYKYSPHSKYNNDWVLKILASAPQATKLVQYLYILSRLTFHIRVPSRAKRDLLEDYQALHEKVSLQIARMLDDETEIDYGDFDWLFDCEEASHCGLYMMLAAKTKNLDHQHWLWKKVIDYAQMNLKARGTKVNEPLIKCFTSAVLFCFPTDSEQYVLDSILQCSAFNTALEPYRKNYDYKAWNKAKEQVVWQMAFLQEYLNANPSAENILEIYNYWNTRILDSGILDC